MPSNSSSIQEIIEGCLNEDSFYQRLLVDKYADLLYAICVRYLKDREFAKDVLQESFMRIFKYLKKYDASKASFEGWAKTVTIRHCLKYLDKKKLAITPVEDAQETILNYNPEILDDIATRELLSMVAQLPEGFRQVFNLAVLDGYSHKEIGAMLGIKEGSARSRLSRAKALLRKRLFNIKLKESWINIS